MFLLDKLTSYEGICGNDVDDFFSVLEPVAPAAQHLLILLFLHRRMLRMPDALPLHSVGHILLCREMPGIVVGVLVTVVIAKLRHKSRGCIAKMQGYGLVARLPHKP